MKFKIFFLMGVPLACLAGCSPSHVPAPKPPEKNVFDALTQTEQRARDVQKTLDDSASRARQSVAAQERGDPAP
jgi:hypothetical protein